MKKPSEVFTPLGNEEYLTHIENIKKAFDYILDHWDILSEDIPMIKNIIKWDNLIDK